LNDGSCSRRHSEWNQHLRAMLNDYFVYDVFGTAGQDETGKAVNDHQKHAKREPIPVSPD